MIYFLETIVEGFFFFVKPKCKKGSPTQQHREVGKRQRTKTIKSKQ